MKVIDLSPLRADDKPFNKFKTRLQGMLKFGLTFEADRKAQDVVEAQLGRVLDNKHTLLRNVTLEGLPIPIPCVLVGPTGLYVLYASGVKGVFRAKEERWAEMNKNSRKYEIVRTNLIARSQLMAKIVDSYLTRHKRPHPPVQPALVFADPGTHVDSVRPAVRVVLRDGLDRFAASIAHERPVISVEDAQNIVSALVKELPTTEYEAEAGAEETPPELAGDAATEMSQPAPAEPPRKAPLRFQFNRKQWILLGAMILFETLILASFAALVLFFS